MKLTFVACKAYASLVFCTGTATKVVVPSHYQGKPVREIGAGVFADHYEIEAVYLPPTVDRIGVNAFGWTRRLRFVGVGDPEAVIPDRSILPNSLRCIEPFAFQHSAIRHLIAPSRELEIGPYAFANSDLQTMELPNCIDLQLEEHCFSHCNPHLISPKTYISEIPARAF